MVSIYVDGLGATTPAFTDGQITSGTGFRVQASMSVTIGGADAPVGFAGLAPGAPAGVYRIDVTVPAGSATGTVPMIVTGGFVPAGTVTMAVQ